jgi:hypothetical protein
MMRVQHGDIRVDMLGVRVWPDGMPHGVEAKSFGRPPREGIGVHDRESLAETYSRVIGDQSDHIG